MRPSTNFVFAHLADAHVGAWPREPAIRRALRETLLRTFTVVDERDCQFLLISGDLFHTPVPDPVEVAPIAAALRKLADRGRRIYVIYGSHDYVAHRTSWLDVLAESGLFLRAAPPPVRSEGDRFTLPFLVDPPTGCRIAGISGRAQGLDRGYFLAVDSESFRAEPGFKIFQFHAAVNEYLPPSMQAHIQGISKEDLPSGCDYYAGGHIHVSYEGTGPNGSGLLVNPGAVFGTSTTDVENAARGRTHQGVVIVTVQDGIPRAEFVDTAPKDLQVFDIDVTGESAAAAKKRLEEEIERREAPGALLFPRVHGTLSDGSVGMLGLRRSGPRGNVEEGGAIHWDVTGLSTVSADALGPPVTTEGLEGEILARLEPELPPSLARSGSPNRLLRELLHELGRLPSEGESRVDYEVQRVEAARRTLGQRVAPPE
ncbi:MAG: DNA repair exonuclease [Thermoplasmata archaeon]|nr:DNA repair exonuclease [Thermoplasmata archaeon]MCI4358858.1 DNA repair exonuclease [Thermoplasmata archaeon]